MGSLQISAANAAADLASRAALERPAVGRDAAESILNKWLNHGMSGRYLTSKTRLTRFARAVTRLKPANLLMNVPFRRIIE